MRTKLIHGVGINDADYSVNKIVNGKAVICPYYQRWCSALTRCYSEKYHKQQPTYIDCTMCDEWLLFSNFKSWMEKQDWQGKELDKDILIQGNKIYKPEACIFVDKYINTLLSVKKSNSGDLPLGVGIHKGTSKFKSEYSIKGKSKKLGVFDTQDEAHDAYKEAKYKLIAEAASNQVEPLRSALLNYKIN